MTPLVDMAVLLDTAVAAAHAAGTHALTNWRRRGEVFKRTAHDVKLQLDLEAQEQAERVIRTRFPDHAILGEESEEQARPLPSASALEQWIIDPIDGTVNFSHGLPWWCSSVAVRRGEELLAGAVFAPALDEIFTAALGSPAARNGAPIRVSAVATLDQALVMTGLDQKAGHQGPPFETFRRLSAAVQRVRVMGSAALEICRVAAGQADGYFESGIFIWDIAAASLIVRQAGGSTEILDRFEGHRLRFLASNGCLHAALRHLVCSTTDGHPGADGAA